MRISSKLPKQAPTTPAGQVPYSRAPLVLALAVTSCGAFGCGDPRRQAVEDLTDFAQGASFVLATPENAYAGYSVVVADSSLADYNVIFGLFQVPDEHRAEFYRQLQTEIFWSLPISSVLDRGFHENGDTLLATVVFERPASEALMARVSSILNVVDARARPPEEAQAAFREAVARVRAELQVVDTVYAKVIPGPRVVGLRTAAMIRDSIVADSLRLEARDHLRALVQEADVQVWEFRNDDRTPTGTPFGGVIKGEVDPGVVGWFLHPDVYASVEVQCEGVGETGSTTTRWYLGLRDPAPDAAEDFTCLWFGDEARAWTRIQPSLVRVRVLAVLYPDTLFGEWVTVR